MSVCLCVCFPFVLETKDTFHVSLQRFSQDYGIYEKGCFIGSFLSDTSEYGLLLISSLIPGSFFSRIYNMIALIPKGL